MLHYAGTVRPSLSCQVMFPVALRSIVVQEDSTSPPHACVVQTEAGVELIWFVGGDFQDLYGLR
jgi:hypothetical protein